MDSGFGMNETNFGICLYNQELKKVNIGLKFKFLDNIIKNKKLGESTQIFLLEPGNLYLLQC